MKGALFVLKNRIVSISVRVFLFNIINHHLTFICSFIEKKNHLILASYVVCILCTNQGEGTVVPTKSDSHVCYVCNC